MTVSTLLTSRVCPTSQALLPAELHDTQKVSVIAFFSPFGVLWYSANILFVHNCAEKILTYLLRMEQKSHENSYIKYVSNFPWIGSNLGFPYRSRHVLPNNRHNQPTARRLPPVFFRVNGSVCGFGSPVKLGHPPATPSMNPESLNLQPVGKGFV